MFSTDTEFLIFFHYRYSGCHDYDVSALNVLLGRHFAFREGDYAMAEPRFFTRMSEDLEADIEEEEQREREKVTHWIQINVKQSLLINP